MEEKIVVILKGKWMLKQNRKTKQNWNNETRLKNETTLKNKTRQTHEIRGVGVEMCMKEMGKSKMENQLES